MTSKMRMWTGSKMLLMDSARCIEAITECYSQQVLHDEIKDSSRVMYPAYDHVGQHGAAFMLASGLKDKNGREIYEGDITLQHGGKCVIEFNHGVFWAKSLKSGWSIQPRLWSDVEVIGNIYENPKLLETAVKEERRIMQMKFFAWHKYRHIMRPCNLYTDQHGVVRYIQLRGDNNRIPVNAVEIRQFTGIRDVNDRDVYEGDVIESFDPIKLERGQDADYRGIVAWLSKSLAWGLVDSAGGFINLLSRAERPEVIGNIYESPGLLETAVSKEG